MRFKSLASQLSKFLTVGVLNTGIDFAILNTLMFFYDITTGVIVSLFTAIAFIVANINSYIFNKKWTFKSSSSATTKNITTNFGAFFIVSIGGLLINVLVIYYMTTAFTPFFGIGNFSFGIMDTASLWVNFAKTLAIGLSLIWNFIGYKLFVFKT